MGFLLFELKLNSLIGAVCVALRRAQVRKKNSECNLFSHIITGADLQD